MRRKTALSMLGAVGLVAFGLATWLLITPTTTPEWASADEFILYSIDGRDPPPDRELKPATGETLLGYPVLGKVAVENPADRRRLEDAFRAATAGPGQSFKCFWPRHVVRLRHGSRTVEYVICFQCQFMQEWVNGSQGRRPSYIARDARPAFDAPLTAAGVPFAPD